MEMCFSYTLVYLSVCMFALYLYILYSAVFLKLQRQITPDTVLTSVSIKFHVIF